jgi:hypothetical protein
VSGQTRPDQTPEGEDEWGRTAYGTRYKGSRWDKAYQWGGAYQEGGGVRAGYGPLYLTGDEWDLVDGMTQEEYEMLQAALVDQNWLNGSFQAGGRDEKTMTAIRSLFGYANNEGMSWEEALSLGPGGGGPGGPGGPGGGSGAALPTPEELGLIFDKVTRETLGRYLDPGEKDAMVGQWMSNPTINPGDFAEIQTGRGSAQFGTEYTAEQFGRLGQDLEGMLEEEQPGGRLTGAGY